MSHGITAKRSIISYDSTNKDCQAGDIKKWLNLGIRKVDMGELVFNYAGCV